MLAAVHLPLLKRPMAWLPIAMSLAALVELGVLAAAYRGAGPRDPDEGTAIHVFQGLIAGQAPIVLLFLGKWSTREPQQAALVLALQIAAAVAAVSPLFLLRLR